MTEQPTLMLIEGPVMIDAWSMTPITSKMAV
jgi:hypothetical protein